MTAIVWRDGVLAADTAAWTGPDACILIPSVPKIQRLPDGGLIAACGAVDEIDQFHHWMFNDGIPDGSKFDKDEGFSAVWIKPDGSLWSCWHTLRMIQTVAPWIALGRSEIFMYGALAAGASAEQTVRLAIEHTDGAGGDVQIERLETQYPSTFGRVAVAASIELLHKQNERTPAMAKWEDSPADRTADRKGAKKAGIPMSKWEGSKADRKMDAAAMKKKKKKK